jgi:Integrase zinc binding domain
MIPSYINLLVYYHFDALKQSLYVDDTLSRILRLQVKNGEPEDFIEDVFEEDSIDADDPNATQIDAIERFGTLKKYHNSSVGHFGIARTMETVQKSGVHWDGMLPDVSKWINECGVCQKIKHQCDPHWQDEVEHHSYSSDPLTSLSIDTLGPLPEDENGNKYVRKCFQAVVQ